MADRHHHDGLSPALSPETLLANEIQRQLPLPFTTNIKNWITKKQSAVPVPVFISLHDDIAVIDINVVLLEGANIPAVCRNIQVAVKEAVQSMTSINVSKVNVTVADIRFHGEKGANTAD